MSLKSVDLKDVKTSTYQRYERNEIHLVIDQHPWHVTAAGAISVLDETLRLG